MTGAGGQTSRRDAIKKLGVGGAVAWTAPVVLSVRAAAVASDLPGGDLGGELGGCPCGVNVVRNASFEQRGANWTTTAGAEVLPYGPSVLYGAADPLTDGTWYLLLGPGASASQTVLIDPACGPYTYTLGFNYAVDGLLSARLAFVGSGHPDRVEYIGGSNYTPTRLAQLSYPYQGPVPPGTTSVVLTFAFRLGAGDPPSGSISAVDMVSLVLTC